MVQCCLIRSAVSSGSVDLCESALLFMFNVAERRSYEHYLNNVFVSC